MTKINLFILTVFAFALVVRGDSEHVLELTNDNFDQTIKDNDAILVKFYAPWCGHCKAMAPEYEAAAEKLSESGSKIKLAKVDATVHTELGTKHQVQGYPTLKFFKNGVAMDFNGPRKADGIVQWLEKKMGPALTVVSTADELNKIKEENKVVAAYFSADESGDHYTIMTEIAPKLDTVPFVHIKNAALAKENGLSDAKRFLLFKKFDDDKVVYDGAMKAEDVEKFIKLEKIPLVTEFSQETAQDVFESDIKTHVIAFSGKKSDSFKTHMETLKTVAKKIKGDYHVVVIDMDDSDAQRVGEFFGVTSNDIPTFRVLNMKDDMLKYQPSEKTFEADYIVTFARDVASGKIKPHLKSADEPEDWDKEGVKVLVANKFTERAISKDKAVFVEFYAPWCGHCKALTPIWDELGVHYKDNAEVMIAKCDATENEIEEIKVQSFPTLKFSPKGSEEFVDYKGERTKEEFIKFIDSNGKVEGKKESDDEKHDEL